MKLNLVKYQTTPTKHTQKITHIKFKREINTKISNIMVIMIILCICISSIFEAKPITDATPLLCGRISEIGSNNVDGQNILEVGRHDMQLYHGEDVYYTCQPVTDDHFDSWGG